MMNAVRAVRHPPDQLLAMGHRGVCTQPATDQIAHRETLARSTTAVRAGSRTPPVPTMVNTSTTNTLCMLTCTRSGPITRCRIGINEPTPIWMNPPPRNGAHHQQVTEQQVLRLGVADRLDPVLAGGHQDHHADRDQVPARGRTTRPADARRATFPPSAPTAAAIARLRLSLKSRTRGGGRC